jgi:hypothetical protein
LILNLLEKYHDGVILLDTGVVVVTPVNAADHGAMASSISYGRYSDKERGRGRRSEHRWRALQVRGRPPLL